MSEIEKVYQIKAFLPSVNNSLLHRMLESYLKSKGTNLNQVFEGIVKPIMSDAKFYYRQKVRLKNE